MAKLHFIQNSFYFSLLGCLYIIWWILRTFLMLPGDILLMFCNHARALNHVILISMPCIVHRRISLSDCLGTWKLGFWLHENLVKIQIEKCFSSHIKHFSGCFENNFVSVKLPRSLDQKRCVLTLKAMFHPWGF